MEIFKYVGAGNDFILIPDFEEAIAEGDIPALAVKYCDRSSPWGADGLMVLRKSHRADCRMLFYNADGSTAEMCGNGARCLCRFCHDHGLSGDTQMIETPAGLVTGERLGEALYRIQLNSPTVLQLDAPLSYIELGEPGIPHVVLPHPEDMDRDALRSFARALRYDRRFPKGANVNLYRVTGENTVELMTYERGVEDFTLACGTGTGATVLALTLLGKVTGRHTKVQNRGGALWVDVLKNKDGSIGLFLTGPAEELPL